MILSWERNTNVDYPSFAVFFRFQEVVLNGSKLVRGVLSNCRIIRSGGCERVWRPPELQLLSTAPQINYIWKQTILKAVVFKWRWCFSICSYVFAVAGWQVGFEQEYLLQSRFQANTIHKFSFLSSTKRKEGKKPQIYFSPFTEVCSYIYILFYETII